ncbi:hypothetical protein OG474_30555 [Kribbella sp. NBC_01505]|uniref:hypothetical protein n=1 Tax=Kribbella sp. NBC_01505 TaxID=2903580 RepID=UPI00386BC230
MYEFATKTHDIVGYSYNADIYCPDHIVAQITSNPGDVWHSAARIGAAEMHLDLCARIKGVNRSDEGSFDGGDFPKVIYAEHAVAPGPNGEEDAESRADRCAICDEFLLP